MCLIKHVQMQMHPRQWWQFDLQNIHIISPYFTVVILQVFLDLCDTTKVKLQIREEALKDNFGTISTGILLSYIPPVCSIRQPFDCTSATNVKTVNLVVWIWDICKTLNMFPTLIRALRIRSLYKIHIFQRMDKMFSLQRALLKISHKAILRTQERKIV